MKILKTIAVASVLSFAAISSTYATPSVHFENPIGWAGTGCKAGSVSVTGVNTSTLSVLFDSYDAGKNALSGLGRAGCSFSVPIRVPRGFQVSHVTADWQGFVEGKGQLRRKYFISGEPYIPWKTNNYNMPSGDNFLVTDDLYHSSFKMGCNGGVKTLRINSQIRAMTGSSYAAVDSTDLSNKLIFKVLFAPC